MPCFQKNRLLEIKRLNLKSGQATVEYILIIAMIVAVLLGVFSGPLERLMAESQSRISGFATSVLSQRELGIPLSWFRGSDLPEGQGPGGAGGGGDDENAESDGPQEYDENGNPIGPGARRQGRGSGSRAGLDDSRRQGAGGARSGSRPSNNQGPGGGRGGGAGSDINEEGGAAANTRGAATGPNENTGAVTSSNKEGASSSVVVNKRRKPIQKVQEESSGCDDANLLMLLKIGAIVAILVFVIGMALNKKGDDSRASN